MNNKSLATAVLTILLSWVIWGALSVPGFALSGTEDYIAQTVTEESADEVMDAWEQENAPEKYDEEIAEEGEPEKYDEEIAEEGEPEEQEEGGDESVPEEISDEESEEPYTEEG